MNNTTMRVAAGSILALVTLGAHAQQYPNRPVRMVVPFAPGGTTDVLARIIAQNMTEQFQQTVVVDNRPGAAGVLGATMVAKAAPDGYTILLTSASPVAISITLLPAGTVPYDPEKDLAPISMITRIPSVFASLEKGAIRSVADIIAMARAKPGQVTYGTAGAGSINHLIGELFEAAAGIDLLHVPYKGAGPAVVALLSREVDLVVSSPPAVMSQVRAGSVRAVALSSGKRSAVMQGVATIAEGGVAGFDSVGWYALLTTGGAPRPIVDRLNAALAKALTDPGVVKQLNSEGAEPESSTPEELAKFIRAELKSWAKAIDISGLRKK
jgi:tripartite-type tricarboxylate transporter receptor subunit TctC